MSSPSLGHARDAVADDPRLVDPDVDAEVRHMIEVLCQQGHPDLAERVTFWQALLHCFRDTGWPRGTYGW